MSDTVFVRKTQSYDDALLRERMRELLRLCGADELVKPGARVFVKLNLLRAAKPQEAITTHPGFAGAVAEALLELGAGEVTLGDSPGGPLTAARIEEVYRRCGLLPLENGRIKLLRDFSQVERPAGNRSFRLLGAIDAADLLVNIPKLKTHMLTGMTGAVKNLFGCVPGLGKTELHAQFTKIEGFSDMLCALANLAAPALTIVDAVTGMEGDGPSGGKPREFGFIAASRDIFALDCALAHMLGVEDIAETVKASQRLGLAPKSFTVDDDTGSYKSPLTDLLRPKSAVFDVADYVPEILKRPLRSLVASTVAHPKIDGTMCIGCGRCEEICPVGAARVNEKKARIDKAKCIRCFCCHEVCPKNAIKTVRGAFGFIWRI